jgi:hypothetical protein
MTLATAEFIRRFLIHVLPQGFHRIRHYGLFASGTRADNVARARELLAVAKPERQPAAPPPIKPSRTVHAAAVAWSSLRSSSAVQRHGIGRQVRQPSSGSTPHDRVTIPQKCSSHSLPLGRRRQSALRYPAVVSNRPALAAFNPIHRSCMSSFTVGQLVGPPRLQSHTSSAALKSP